MKRGAQIRILVAWSDAADRQRWMDRLAGLDAEIEWGVANDFPETIRLVTRETWDLALLGIEMPGRVGLLLVKYLRSDFPKVPVIVLSRIPEAWVALRVMRLGARSSLPMDAPSEELQKAAEAVQRGEIYISSSAAELMIEAMVWHDDGTNPPPSTSAL